jgi:hypothetical protein
VLAVLRDPALRRGTFGPIQVGPAGEDDRTHDGLVAFAWRGAGADGAPCVVVVVNLRAQAAWARIPLAGAGFQPSRTYRLLDRLDGALYRREGGELSGPGLFVALRPRQSHLFTIEHD